MKRFNVTVRIGKRLYAYIALSSCSADVICDAIDFFGPCCVTVKARHG